MYTVFAMNAIIILDNHDLLLISQAPMINKCYFKIHNYLHSFGEGKGKLHEGTAINITVIGHHETDENSQATPRSIDE